MTPQELRALSRKCRKWAMSSTDPDNTALFKIWATDLADEADEIERRTEYRSLTAIATRCGKSGTSRGSRNDCRDRRRFLR
jgi:hypothetical protein